MGNKIPCLPNVDALIKAGINPQTGLPYKMSGDSKVFLKENVKKMLKIIDEQDAVNRGNWVNIPCNLSSQELERLLYFKGQLAFFYMKETDEFFFMPYALDGTIDFYGRYNTIHPVPMTSGTTKEEKSMAKTQSDILSQKKLKCVYGVVAEEDVDYEMMTECCVLLRDYSNGLAQEIEPRCSINDCLIDAEAECIPLMRTHLISSCGVEGVRVQDDDQAESIRQASKGIIKTAMNGEIYAPITGTIDFQELAGKNNGKAEEYMLAMQTLDNLRLSTYGLENGGLFEKKSHMLQEEQDVNNTNVGLVAQDYISIRQNFCNIVNSIWGLGIWFEPSENVSNADINGDGVTYDENFDGENGGVENANNDSTI